MYLTKTANGLVKFELRFYVSAPEEARYVANDQANWLNPEPLENDGSATPTFCEWPDTVTLEAVALPSLSVLADDDGACIADQPPPGQAVIWPFTGAPVPDCGATVPVVPVTDDSISDDCFPADAASCDFNTSSCGGGCGPGNGNTGMPDATIQETMVHFGQQIPQWWPGPRISLTTGSLHLDLGVPPAGPFDPVPTFSYSSRRADKTSENGRGFTGMYNSEVTSVDTNTAEVLTGLGRVLRFTSKDANGLYDAPPGSPLKLVQLAGGTWSLTYPNGNVVRYKSSGHLDYLANVAGNRWTLSHDAGDRVESIENPFGRLTTLAYDASNNLESVEDAWGRMTTFVVDGSGNLTKRTSPELCELNLHYDGNHRLQAVEDPEENRYTYAYDTNGLINSVQTPLGHITTFDFVDWTTTKIVDPQGNVTTLTHNVARNIQSVTNPLGQTTTYLWEQNQLCGMVDALGNRTTLGFESDTDDNSRRPQFIQRPLGQLTTLVYNNDDKLSAVVNPLGARTTLSWNASGQRDAIVDALGNRTTFGYNAQGRVETVTDALGNVTTLAYDDATCSGREDPLGHVTTYVHGSYDQVVGIENPLGERTTLTRDAMNRVTAKVNPLGSVTTYTYTLSGRPQTTENALGERTTTIYDVVGHVQATVNALGYRTTLGYDSIGNRIARVNPLGHVITNSFDAARRMVASENPLGNISTNVFDQAGRQVATVDPLGNRSTTVYDSNSHRVASENPLGNRWSTTYDDAGRAIASEDPLGNRATSVYDEVGRQTASVDPLGNRSTNSYDKVGRMVASINPLGNRSTSVYDAARRQIASVDPLGNRSTTIYDAAGRREASVNPLGYRTSSVYDVAGQLIASIDALGNRSSQIYDNAGRQLASIDPLGNRSTSLYDGAGRVEATMGPRGFRTTLSYDAAGQQVAVTNARGYTTTTVHDEAGRTEATIDALGNRTTLSYDAAGQQTAVTNALGFISTSVYDDAGQSVASVNALGASTTFSYDAAGRNQSITDALGNISTTVFDAAGSDNVLMEEDANGDPTAVYTNEPGMFGELVSQERGGVESFYHFDAQGSTRELTDSDETVTDEYTYTAFGEIVASSGVTVNTYRFATQAGWKVFDTGLYEHATHVYSPHLGRMVNVATFTTTGTLLPFLTFDAPQRGAPGAKPIPFPWPGEQKTSGGGCIASHQDFIAFSEKLPDGSEFIPFINVSAILFPRDYDCLLDPHYSVRISFGLHMRLGAGVPPGVALPTDILVNVNQPGGGLAGATVKNRHAEIVFKQFPHGVTVATNRCSVIPEVQSTSFRLNCLTTCGCDGLCQEHSDDATIFIHSLRPAYAIPPVMVSWTYHPLDSVNCEFTECANEVSITQIRFVSPNNGATSDS